MTAAERCGELLRAITPKQGANQNFRGGASPKVTRTSAARDAGLSRDQKRTAAQARIEVARHEALRHLAAARNRVVVVQGILNVLVEGLD